MYGYSSSSNDLSYFSSHFPLPDVMTLSNFKSFSNEFDSVSALMKQEFCYTASNTSSGCSSHGSPSSLTSYGTTQVSSLMQRSVSSHSLQKNVSGFQYYHQPTEFLDSDSSPVRKAFSTGDLHRMNMVQHIDRSESPLSNESNIIEGVNAKATRYSPEEKKEKIERYRSKRNHRNFNKKIKYVCRKTLADSRPRVRGRFARNDEIEKAPQNEWNRLHLGTGDHQDLEYYDENWIGFLDAISANLIP